MQRSRLPPLNALRSFEVAARHLSFTKAADELFVTQAAVSHQIKSLEEFLSIKLFVRKNRSLLLTEQGQGYYLELKEIFDAVHHATQKVLASNAMGAITVAMPPSFASQWLVPRIHQFSQAFPDIDVRIKAVDADDGFLVDDVDIAVYYGRGKWPTLQADKLHTEFLTPVCSPSLFAGSRPLETLKDLKHHRLLHDSTRDSWRGWIRYFNISGVKVEQGPIFSHTMMVLQAAALGQGIALANSVLAKPELDSGRLICPFEERLISKSSYYLVSHPSQAELGKIATFKQWLLSQIKEEQDEDYY